MKSDIGQKIKILTIFRGGNFFIRLGIVKILESFFFFNFLFIRTIFCFLGQKNLFGHLFQPKKQNLFSIFIL